MHGTTQALPVEPIPAARDIGSLKSGTFRSPSENFHLGTRQTGAAEGAPVPGNAPRSRADPAQ